MLGQVIVCPPIDVPWHPRSWHFCRSTWVLDLDVRYTSRCALARGASEAVPAVVDVGLFERLGVSRACGSGSGVRHVLK